MNGRPRINGHSWMNGRLWMRRLALALLAPLAACAPLWLPVALPPAAPEAVAHPVVFVPGLTGSKLSDPRDGALIWGATAQLLRPHDGGYRLALPLAGDDHPQAGYRAGEPVWQMPLEAGPYRKLLDSNVADMRNIGGPYGGCITAAIFLSEFTGEVPWAHLDIAGPMKVDGDESWRSKGATGFGTRMLIDTVTNW